MTPAPDIHQAAKMRLVRRALDLMDAGRSDEAEATLRSARSLFPDHPEPEYALGQLLLSLGRFQEGWPLLAARTTLSPRLVPPVAVSYPEWRGETLAGRSLLVWVEQGLGDQIMFSRFIGPLRAAGARVTLACNPALADLFAPLADAVIAVSPQSQVEVPRHDYWSRYFSLPQALGVTLETLPAAPYLHVPPDHGPPGARVGLVWATSATGPLAQGKSLDQALIQPWLDRGFASLRPEDTGSTSFLQTARRIAGLDLVITVDTAVAHLAGAMGAPVWILLPYRRLDWRWMGGRGTSPWYPRARLFRQEAPDDWVGVLAQVETALTEIGQGPPVRKG